jgi:hypothetical protein
MLALFSESDGVEAVVATSKSTAGPGSEALLAGYWHSLQADGLALVTRPAKATEVSRATVVNEILMGLAGVLITYISVVALTMLDVCI